MYNFDSYNVLLSIATNIPVLLMTASVLQGHMFSLISAVCSSLSLVSAVFAQLFWEKRLNGLRSSDVSEEALRPWIYPKVYRVRLVGSGLNGVCRWLVMMGAVAQYRPDSSDETLLSAIASALAHELGAHHGSDVSAAEKNPAICLNTSQPLCKAFTVTDDDIR